MSEKWKQNLLLFAITTLFFSVQSSQIVAQNRSYTPVTAPNGSTLSWKLVNGVKEYRLSVEKIEHELAPGMKIKAWGYNGQTPGPVIEAVEGDRVRILVTNKLSEPTAVHWHGIFLPNGMDGVSGLTQKGIQPGETFAYEFTLRQHGTFMYHSHGDEMVQIGMGTMGFFIVHPKTRTPKIDRDFVIFLNEWFVEPGSAKPNPSVMTDFNLFTFNSKVFPGTAPLIVKKGDRVRIRFGNVGQESHPIHIHGHNFKVVATDGGDVPASAQFPETTAVVFPGQTRDVEFIATASGDWPLHCHRRHHPMNAMGHDVANMLGVSQKEVSTTINTLVPGYMPMGEHGMEEMNEMAGHMKGPDNTLPMMAGEGQFGHIGMGGMFTVVKVRENLKSYEQDPGWYTHPKGTVAVPAKSQTLIKTKTQFAPPTQAVIYTCPMHPEIRRSKPGNCPICGMTLVPASNETKTSAEEKKSTDAHNHH